jgi:diguanylate cyclase (GGDEF)-like protein
MHDRSSEQRPKIYELVELERSAGKDLAWIVAVCVVLIATAVSFDAFGRFQRVSAGLTDQNLNGVVALLVVAPVGATMYALRRYREGMRAQRTLAGLTVHDGLTGLPNRRFLGKSFTDMLQDQRRELGHLMVLFVDLDRFKAVNDTYGHEVGDHLMKAVAERLLAAVRESDVVIRFAGDEFVLLIGGVPNPGVAERVASRMIHILETPFELGQDRIQISASVGIALDDGLASADDLIRDADAAMYQAKNHGRGTFAFFERSMRDRLTPATAEKRMRKAIEAGEFHLAYRPVVSLWTRRIVSVEAVIRWEEPTRGTVHADEFVPALEETGLIVPVGNWLIRQACEQSRTWRLAFPDRPPVNFILPVVPRQLSQADFVDRVRWAIEETGASPDSIVLQIDERSVSGDMGMLRQTIRAARAIGVRVALDDPGAGLSSLGHVRHFDIDILKVDASYVAGAAEDRRDAAVVAHVIGLAKALGVVTLAEGVETAEHVEALRALGCDLAQGDYFASPIPPQAIEELFRHPAVHGEWQPSGSPITIPDDLEPVIVLPALPR